MTKVVQVELRHLPKGDVGSPQNELRKLYNARRRHDLTINKTRRETLHYCVGIVEKKHPGFVPEYDKTFFRTGESFRNGLIQRFRKWRKKVMEVRASRELLEIIAKEMERSSTLESQLKIEREKSSNFEIDLGIINRALAEKESKINRLNIHIDLLERELRSTLEACLLSYLKEHNGIISIKEYASQLKIREAQIKKVIETLEKSGKIKIA